MPLRPVICQACNDGNDGLSLFLPDAGAFEGQPIRLMLSQEDVLLQPTRVPLKEIGDTEQWRLSNVESDVEARTVAAIKSDGSAVTEQWVLVKCGGVREGQDFTLVIIEGDIDVRGVFVDQAGFPSKLRARKFKIRPCPCNFGANEDSTRRSWVLVEVGHDWNEIACATSSTTPCSSRSLENI